MLQLANIGAGYFALKLILAKIAFSLLLPNICTEYFCRIFLRIIYMCGNILQNITRGQK